jgi:hypothetical protein
MSSASWHKSQPWLGVMKHEGCNDSACNEADEETKAWKQWREQDWCEYEEVKAWKAWKETDKWKRGAWQDSENAAQFQKGAVWNVWPSPGDAVWSVGYEKVYCKKRDMWVPRESERSPEDALHMPIAEKDSLVWTDDKVAEHLEESKTKGLEHHLYIGDPIAEQKAIDARDSARTHCNVDDDENARYVKEFIVETGMRGLEIARGLHMCTDPVAAVGVMVGHYKCQGGCTVKSAAWFLFMKLRPDFHRTEKRQAAIDASVQVLYGGWRFQSSFRIPAIMSSFSVHTSIGPLYSMSTML